MPGPASRTSVYRGRIAPSPTGYLHLGHARTFWTARQRANDAGGVLVLRNEDLDPERCKAEFATAMMDDLRWFGFDWQEGPDRRGPFEPYVQSRRRSHYVAAFLELWRKGFVYPCQCSRRDVQLASRAPHAGDEEPIYPGTCRESAALKDVAVSGLPGEIARNGPADGTVRINWRFRVPDGEALEFVDRNAGPQQFVAGRDFGDFVLWRHDDVPSYQLAVTVDDAAMRITEVVRGADLLMSTARQLLIYRALGADAPAFHHCPLVLDEQGVRLAKRHDSLSLRALRASGRKPGEIRAGWGD